MHHYDYRAETNVGRVCLELSLKPFGYDKSVAGCEAVARELFTKWQPLLRYASGCAILLWTSDGSEILDYTGDLDDEFEWCRYIGIGNWDRTKEKNPAKDKEDYCLHRFPIHYMENPPEMTYRDLKNIIAALKKVGQEMTGFSIEIGETFDPGPEFAYSYFKFERHPEIATGSIMGAKRWVHCASRLHADNRAYAAYPNGIPEGTHLGEFLGRQFMAMKRDLGFDYIWLSNGFGFSLQSWNWTGELFDGEGFDFSAAARITQNIREFWEYFTREIGDTRVETRGSNLSTGMDIAAHGCPIDDIYAVKNLVGPPNSPWAALNYRFGLELVGYMSHIAKAPEKGYAFRYYIHDPWWHNSPWFDRYGRSPHDIYLPLAVACLDSEGKAIKPYTLDMLSIDDSFGKMPDRCNMEVIPHILTAYNDYPDAPGMVTWVYPFDMYCRLGLKEGKMERIMMDDWLMESAMDYGFPVSSVISDHDFIGADTKLWKNTILTMPVPEAGSALETALMTALHAGARVILYGTTEYASAALREKLGVTLCDPIEGEMNVETNLPLDTAEVNAYSRSLQHIALLSGGGIREQACDGANVCAAVTQGSEKRAYVVRSTDGQIMWIRGSFPHRPSQYSLPDYRNPAKDFVPGVLFRSAMSKFGYTIHFDCYDISTRLPVVLFSRCREALWMNSFVKDTTVKMQITTPDGAPAFRNTDFIIENDTATYALEKSTHNDCRAFVKQKNRGRIRCMQLTPYCYNIMDEKIVLEDLDDATVTFYPPRGGSASFYCTSTFVGNAPMYVGDNVESSFDAERGCYVVPHVSGFLYIGWQEKEHIGEHEKLEFLIQ